MTDLDPEGVEPISDDRLAELRSRTGGWPSNSAECYALVATIDSLRAELDATLIQLQAAEEERDAAVADVGRLEGLLAIADQTIETLGLVRYRDAITQAAALTPGRRTKGGA